MSANILARYRDLGELERDVAPVADNLGADCGGPLSALCCRWLTTWRMGEDAPHLPFAVFVGIGSVWWISRFQICAAFDTHGLKAVF
jgi:hypothetical protein